jgi:hypothetical protein
MYFVSGCSEYGLIIRPPLAVTFVVGSFFSPVASFGAIEASCFFAGFGAADDDFVDVVAAVAVCAKALVASNAAASANALKPKTNAEKFPPCCTPNSLAAISAQIMARIRTLYKRKRQKRISAPSIVIAEARILKRTNKKAGWRRLFCNLLALGDDRRFAERRFTGATGGAEQREHGGGSDQKLLHGKAPSRW